MLRNAARSALGVRDQNRWSYYDSRRTQAAEGEVRLLTTTQKVETNFGSHYICVDRDPTGRIISIGISSPGKFDNSELSEFVIQLQDAINSVIDGD